MKTECLTCAPSPAPPPRRQLIFAMSPHRRRPAPAHFCDVIDEGTPKGKDTMARGSNSKGKARKSAAKVKKEPAKTTSSTRAAKKVKSKGSESSSANDGKTSRPTSDECIYATVTLAKLHPHVVDKNEQRRKTLLESCGLRDSITDSVISTMLSQNTTDKNSKQAWAQLKEAFPEWEPVCDPQNLPKVEAAIKVAGLAKTRAERIHKMLCQVREERGTPSLDYLRDMTDEEVKLELSRFKGLGPKTISCVLLFAMGRSEFPVDTHVLRISKSVGWVPNSATRESAYEHLNVTIPSQLKLDLHCLLVTHGKHCHTCAANGKPQFPPKDGTKLVCPLVKSTMASNVHAVVAAAAKKAGAGVKTEDAIANAATSAAAGVKTKVKVEESDGSATTKHGKVRVKKEKDDPEDDDDKRPKKKSKRVVVKKEEEYMY